VVWAVCLLVVLLVAWWWGGLRFGQDRVATQRSLATRQADGHAFGLHLALTSRSALTEGLARFVTARESSGTLTMEAFETFAGGQYSMGSGVRTIQVAPAGVIRWTYPLKGNEQVIGLDVLNRTNPETREDARRAMRTGLLTVSGPIQLTQGGLGVVLRKAVVVRGETWGLAATVLDVPPVLVEAGLTGATSTYRFAIKDSKGRVFAGEPTVLQAEPVSARAELPEGAWTVYLAPKSGGWGTLVEQDVNMFRMATLAIVVLVTLSAYLMMSRQQRLTQLVAERTADLTESDHRSRALFERSPVSLWEEDFSGVKRRIDELAAVGVTDLRAHLHESPHVLGELVSLIGIREVNAATLGLYGVGSREEILSGLITYSTPESQEVFLAQMVAVAAGSTEFWGDSAMCTPEGVTKHVAVRWTVMPGHERDYGSVIVSIVDLTDRVIAQRELDAIRLDLEDLVERRTAELAGVNQELREAQQAKDAFLANMSHELRTPLNSVLGFTGIMLQGIPGPLNEEQRHQLEMVRRSGRQLLALVNDVLDLAKIEAGRTGVELTDVEVSEVVERLTEVLEPLAREKGLTLDSDLPAEPVRLRTDKDRLGQILTNLSTNAVKFTESGRVSLIVRAGLEEVVFVVRDTGPGIPLEEQDAIFQPFHQLPSESAAKAPGTGLGLSIARELAELLGGTLSVEAADGGGSEFTLCLPKAGPEARRMSPPAGPGSRP
jgi:signal transduction histidine kinase/sensor domain CHASE-containing protein